MKKTNAKEQITTCAELIAQYESIQYHCETKRQYVARMMNLSLPQVSRIMGYFRCIPEIQELIRMDILPLSCTDQMAPRSREMQKLLYKALSSAVDEGIGLSRDRIVIPITEILKENPTLCWSELRTYLNIVEDKKYIPKNRAFNHNCSVAKGQRFVDAVVELMCKNGYADAQANSRKACDYMCDAMATDPNGRKMVFQMKCHYNGQKEGKTAVVEAATAKLNYGADIAVAVTNTMFLPGAVKLSAELDVILWSGEYLRETLGWNGECLG